MDQPRPSGVPRRCHDRREAGIVADEVLCATMPETFTVVGLWYPNLEQTTDDEVRGLEAAAAHPPMTRSA